MLNPIRPSRSLGAIGPYLVPTRAQEGEKTAYIADSYYTHTGEYPVPWSGVDTDPWAVDATDMLVWSEADYRDYWPYPWNEFDYYAEANGGGGFGATVAGWGFEGVQFTELTTVIPVDGPFCGRSQVPEARDFPLTKVTKGKGRKALPWYIMGQRPHVRLMIVGRTA